MKTLFEEPVYRIGQFLYQQVDDSVEYRCRHETEVEWSGGYKCPPSEWKKYVLDVGVIDENAV